MLNKKDKQILKSLDRNSRQSIAQIAKKSHINKETVNYTIKKLEKEGIIQGYFSLVNYFKLGANIFKLLVRYKNIGEKGELKMTDWLVKRKETIWVGKTEGQWDMIITIKENAVENIYKFLEDFNEHFSKNIQDKQLLISYELNWLNEKHLYENTKEYYKMTTNQFDKKEKTDKIDNIIIKELEENARTPLIEISKKTKLTAEAVAKRIKNLFKKRIIVRNKVRLNFEKLDKGYHHLFISLKDFSKIKEITDYYENSNKCTFFMLYHGHYDLHLELISESQKDFREIITDFREKFGNIIADYQQLTILKEFKLLQ